MFIHTKNKVSNKLVYTLRKERRRRMLIYVCSPYSGQIELNVVKARNYSKYVVDAGHTPIAPHLLFPQFLNDDIPEERNLAMQMNMEILKKCNRLWVFGKIFKINLAHSRKRAIAQEVAKEFSCSFDEVENVFFINATSQIQSKVQILRDAVSEFVIRCKREEEHTP